MSLSVEIVMILVPYKIMHEYKYVFLTECFLTLKNKYYKTI